MDDLDMLARDFGFGPRGKSKPMRSAQTDRRSIDEPLFSDVFGGPPKYTPSSNSSSNNKHSSMDDFDYDSMFNSSAAASEAKKTSNSSSKTASVPVYDKPVYDEDIFDGLPGLKSSKSASSTVRFEDDVFASVSSPPSTKRRNHNNDFDDLFGSLGRNEKPGENNKSTSAKSSLSSKGFDDLLGGFGSGNSAACNRPQAESYMSSIPTGGSKHKSALDDPFVALESNSDQASLSSGVYADPLGEISKVGKSRSVRAEASSGGGGAFDDLDPLNSFGKPATSFSPGRDKSGKDGSPSRSATPQSATTTELKGNSSFRYSESNMEETIPLDNFQEPPSFDVPNVSTDFQKSFGQNASAPQYYETDPQVDMSPTSGQGHQYDDVWLTVSEIPLLTQPTAAPPPSRPPPPLPRHSRSERGSFSSNSRKKADEFSSPTSYSQHSQSPKPARPAAKGPPVSQIDELEDFAMGRSQNSVDERASPHASEETSAFSAAAASAAAMKDAMDKAEAKFRHAKEVREREYAKAARNKESVQLVNDGPEREFREAEERLDRERKQKEEEEREQRRIERERSREIEREKARQAVERATREARERAAVEARERAAAEARLKAERAVVDKVNAEARGRAERVAVQRAQAEARERAAAEAKERAEKAAAEARERATAAEASEKAAVARAEAEAEARRRAERAAVERAASEARQRAAAEARERASTAAKMNQQKNDDDLESFFNMGRASSAPRPRSNSTDPLFDQQFQNKGGFEAAKRTSSSSGAPSNIKKASSTTNIVDDLSSIFGAAPSSGGFQDVEGETEERRRARLDRHQRTQERAAKALAEKNQRDLQVLRDQEERHRISETLDIEIKRWAAGKEGNLRALLSTMQYVLWPECGWQPVSLTDLITGASVKKVYRKATLCIHPDKVQQKGATLQQKYIAEKVFDLLKEAWNKFNSEELF
ncbi:hypothetical protein BUALT_Bualt02G0165300 [Buddleja alternifolia]|uniref:Auxilin-related protein 2 n=1 Tax=Buddleja alternifolia TaxID=168488 RepID=A0AAV6YBJ1_9LAMI|nr:hypothetical protein BUALT_Bualt02G0165300 [Buddleja alternifolia]